MIQPPNYKFGIACVNMLEKINYIHDNPVSAVIVRSGDEYIYSSALDYSRKGKGLVKVIVV